MSDLPENMEQLLEMRRADNIKKMDDVIKLFREMKSKNNSLKRKNVIENIFKEELEDLLK